MKTLECLRNFIKLSTILAIGVILIIATGCLDSDSGDSAPIPQQYADGIWEGTFTSTSFNDPPYPIVGIICQSNEARFISNEGVQYFGFIPVSENRYSGTLAVLAHWSAKFHNGSSYGEVDVAGSVYTARSMIGSYSGDIDTGIFSLAYNSIYERDSSLATIAGEYLMEFLNGHPVLLRINIEIDGTITGSDNFGADYDGQVTILDPAFNCYRINMTDSVGPYTYTGLAALGDTAVQDDTLYLAVTEANVRSVVGILLRQ